MIECYKRSKKAFKEFVKENPNSIKSEWDRYAQDNCLFSANTLMFHMFDDNLIEYLNRRNIDKFEYLKNMFLWIPVQYRNQKIFSTLIKIQRNNKTKEKKVEKNG